MRPSYVEIDLNAIVKNYYTLKNLISEKTEFMAVVKANAYGYGLIEVSKKLEKEGVHNYAVAIVEEGIELRKAGIKGNILILGYIPKDDYEKIVKYDLTPAVYCYEQALDLDKVGYEQNKTINTHIKIDTGMSRLGFSNDEKSIREIVEISKLENIYIKGIYSHLATSDIENDAFAFRQFNILLDIIEKLKYNKVIIEKKHIANSGGTINYPSFNLDMVRVGTSLYGLYPNVKMAEERKVELIQAMTIKSIVANIRSVKAGISIGYSRNFISTKDSVIGIVPMGYVDGVTRSLSNKGCVLIKGKRCKIVGNICMDQFMVDITDVDGVEIGEEVVLMGRQNDEEITAEELGELTNTVSIEFVSRISRRVPYMFLNS